MSVVAKPAGRKAGHGLASRITKGSAPEVDSSKVPKNSKGGVLVTEEELKAAFDFFDIDGRGKITTGALRKRLGAFYRNMSPREYRFLMDNKPEITLDDLRNLLLDNEVTNFDPVAEAFKAYDPEGTGYVDGEVLRTIFQNLGFGDITDEDLAILVEAADGDGDGKISLEDFRGMSEFKASEAAAAAAAAADTSSAGGTNTRGSVRGSQEGGPGGGEDRGGGNHHEGDGDGQAAGAREQEPEVA